MDFGVEPALLRGPRAFPRRAAGVLSWRDHSRPRPVQRDAGHEVAGQEGSYTSRAPDRSAKGARSYVEGGFSLAEVPRRSGGVRLAAGLPFS